MTDVRSRIAAMSPQQRARLEARAAEQAARDRGGEAIRPRDRGAPAPLSFAQQREWALERFRPSNNIIGALRIEGEFDLGLLARCLTEITARHEVLRSTVELVGGVPAQVVAPVEPVPLPVLDLSGLDPEAQDAEIRRCCVEEVTRPFPPEQAAKLRATVLRLGPSTHVGLLIMHHAASDGWSASIVIREAVQLYQLFAAGVGNGLPPLPVQYADFAVWQRERLGEARIAAEVEYWRGVLDGAPPRLELPTDRPHPARRTYAAAQHVVELPAEVAVPLRRFAEAEGVSVSMIIAAAAAVLLHRYTGQDDLVLGAAVSGRVRTETEQLIGCFANALPLRLRLHRSQTLSDVLAQARDVVSGAFDHQDVPFDRLVEELAPGEGAQTPLIQMMVNVLTSPGEIFRPATEALESPGLRILPEPVELGPVPIDLILIVTPRPDSVVFQWHYSTELFEESTVRRLAAHFGEVLDQLMHHGERTVGQAVLAGAASPVAAAREPEIPGVVERFERRAAAAPDDPAVVCAGESIAFAELNRRANRLARRLRALGVGPETRVGILAERSPRLAVAVLGVLKAGGAFLPVDPASPPGRVSETLADAGATVVVGDRGLVTAEGVEAPHPVLLDEESDWAESGEDLSEAIAPGSAAYVIYTSGSTGSPKGVVIEHRSLATFAEEVAQRLGLGAADRFLQFASPGFDVLVEELFPVWLAGGAVVFPAPEETGVAIDPVAVAERDRVSVMELPAAFWHEWVRQLDLAGKPLPPSLRLVIVGSERVLPERLAMWRKLGVPLMNVYGITETTVSSTFFRLGRDAAPEDLRHLPIGTALPSVRARVLDADLRPVPAGAIGELYLGGPGVGRGYLGRPGATAERFVADPDPARPGERVYRTGDLVRERADGNLEFLSRADAQLKVRGFRVEPAEIESAACRHPQVAQAVVTVHEPVPGTRRLVAYVVPPARTRANITDLRRFLGRELPHYLVPAAFVQLERLPVTVNGKTDFSRLPEPGEERAEEAPSPVAPRSPGEERLAGIVADVLGITLVGVDDNFFELGGDSIQAIQVAARAQEEGIELSPLDLFESPTVALLAARWVSAVLVISTRSRPSGPRSIRRRSRR
ncbi:non-ribosomal peptide synthetase [Amycolatopsis nivea]